MINRQKITLPLFTYYLNDQQTNSIHWWIIFSLGSGWLPTERPIKCSIKRKQGRQILHGQVSRVL